MLTDDYANYKLSLWKTGSSKYVRSSPPWTVLLVFSSGKVRNTLLTMGRKGMCKGFIVCFLSLRWRGSSASKPCSKKPDNTQTPARVLQVYLGRWLWKALPRRINLRTLRIKADRCFCWRYPLCMSLLRSRPMPIWLCPIFLSPLPTR